MKSTFEKLQDKVIDALKEHRSLTLSALSQYTGSARLFTVDRFRENVIHPLVESRKVSVHQTRQDSFLVCIEQAGDDVLGSEGL
jgi:hypothetical protein